MTSKEDILKFLASESGPITGQQLGEKMGLSTEQFTTQVKRMVKQDPPLVEMNEDKQYFITDEGREHLESQNQVLPPQGILQQSDNPQAVISDYQKFILLGSQAGITNKELLRATADHVWNGGEYTDLIWVRQALKEANIQPDLANRWTAFWRSHLRQPTTPQLQAAMSEGTPGVKSEQKKPGEGIRTHSLDADDKPVYVGEGMGDLSEERAFELSKIRSAARARVAIAGNGRSGVQTPGDMADQFVKIVAAVDQFRGQQSPPVNYVVKPKADGTGFEVATTEPGVPMMIPEPKAQASKSYFVDPQTKEVKELDSSKPNVFFLPAPPVAQTAGNVVRYLVDKATGTVTPLTGNEPIIIQSAPPNPYIPIQMDKDGNPVVPPNLDTWFRLEDFKTEQRRKQESHEVKMDFIQKARDFMGKAITAMSRTGGDGK